GVFTGSPKFSNNDYYTSNKFEDDRNNFTGTLAQWQGKGYDAGSTYNAGSEPLSGDINHDGRINIDDYMVIDDAFPQGQAGAWWQADANLDGSLDTDDYVVIDTQAGAAQTASAAVMGTANAAVSPVIAQTFTVAQKTDDVSDVVLATL